jgi:glycine cleavage system H protein
MTRGSYNIIPAGENHCVWKDAGLVSYKLCDRNFECESCPFDRVMKTRREPIEEAAGGPTAAPTAVHQASQQGFDDMLRQWLEPLRKAPLPNDRIYFSNHLWLKRLSDGGCRVGIDGCLSRLLHPILGAVLISTPAQLGKDSPFAWLLRDRDTLSLHSPASGSVTATNAALTSKPSMLTSDPYDQGWIMMLTPRSATEHGLRGYSSEAFAECLDRQVGRIETLVSATLGRRRQDVGPSLFDGGRRVETIEQLVGTPVYTKLLAMLLHPRGS